MGGTVMNEIGNWKLETIHRQAQLNFNKYVNLGILDLFFPSTHRISPFRLLTTSLFFRLCVGAFICYVVGIFFQENMENQNNYVPPPYIPLGQSDLEAEAVSPNEGQLAARQTSDGLAPWSSGICACCDDMQSCLVGLICPCYLFGKNAEFLGSGTLIGSCMTHFILWALVNTLCCCITDGILLGLPGCFVACYACGYRRALREKYGLQEAPCGDFITHFFCHLCANCQEYREIGERACRSIPGDLKFPVVTAPSIQMMESGVAE